MFKVDFYLLNSDENASFTLEVDSVELYYQKRGTLTEENCTIEWVCKYNFKSQ